MRNRPIDARDAAPASVSATKMELFGISTDELSNKRKSIDPYGNGKDHFELIQSSCLANLVQKL